MRGKTANKRCVFKPATIMRNQSSIFLKNSENQYGNNLRRKGAGVFILQLLSVIGSGLPLSVLFSFYILPSLMGGVTFHCFGENLPLMSVSHSGTGQISLYSIGQTQS